MASGPAPDTSDALPLNDAEVAAWRRRFPILSRQTYLINNSLGAMPDTVPASLATFADAWATEGVEAWRTTWFPEVRRVSDLLGSLIGAPSGTVTVHQNVAALMAIVVSGINWDTRDEVVISAIDWPSHHNLLEQHRRSVDVVVAEPEGALSIDTDRFCSHITERTALVIVSHVLFRSGAITDVAAIVAAARAMGAVVLVDGYHATGHMPVDVLAMGCDFYVGGSVKWLCGGPGVGYLYVRPGMRELWRPWAVGWLGHRDPFDFDTAWDAAPGALGWLGGTPSMPALYSAREGYRVISEVGPARIRETSKALTSHLVAAARGRGFTVNTPVNVDYRAGGVTLDLGAQTKAAARRLIDAGIIVDYRPGGGIRVGAHFFSTLEEIDRLIAALV